MRPAPGCLPKYIQIAELLVRDIVAGRLIDGERLPPEREMAENLQIAVGTLRKALAELENRDLLQRIQGSGNYIRAVSDPQSVYSMFRLELIDGGGLPTAKILELTRLKKEPDMPRFGKRDDAHRIRRLRFLSGKSAALEEIWLDTGYAETLNIADMSESLYLFYREKLGLWISRAEDRIGLDQVPEWSPADFGMSPGTPAPFVTRVSRDQNGKPAEFSRTWFDPAVAHYVARLK